MTFLFPDEDVYFPTVYDFDLWLPSGT